MAEADTGRTSVGVYAGGDATTGRTWSPPRSPRDGGRRARSTRTSPRRRAIRRHRAAAVSTPHGAGHPGSTGRSPAAPARGSLRRPGPDGSVGALLDQWIDDLRFSNTQDGD